MVGDRQYAFCLHSLAPAPMLAIHQTLSATCLPLLPSSLSPSPLLLLTLCCSSGFHSDPEHRTYCGQEAVSLQLQPWLQVVAGPEQLPCHYMIYPALPLHCAVSPALIHASLLHFMISPRSGPELELKPEPQHMLAPGHAQI